MPQRVKLYDAEDIARNMRETFTARPVRERREMPFTWPTMWQNVGESLAVGYASNKWQKTTDKYDLYKHIAESTNRALVVPEFLRDFDDPAHHWPVFGPRVSLADVVMPRHFAVLAHLEEMDLRLYVGEDEDGKPVFGHGDEGVIHVTVKQGLLGGGMFHPSPGFEAPFLLVYHEQDGPLAIIVGEDLDVEKDGIVG